MARRFEAADLVLSRSGASTVAEEMAAGKPALLVPFPGAADDHQRKNAEVMAGAGAATLLIESEMTPERLLASLTECSATGLSFGRWGNGRERWPIPMRRVELPPWLRNWADPLPGVFL